MTFEDYLQEQFGSFVSELSNEDVQKLKVVYDKLLIWQNTADITLKQGLKGKEVDYTNDFEKAMKNVKEASFKLTTEVNQLKAKLGIEEGITSQHRM